MLSASWSSSPLSVGSLDDDDDEEEDALFKDNEEEEEEEEDDDEEGLSTTNRVEEGLGGGVVFSLSLEVAPGVLPFGVGLL